MILSDRDILDAARTAGSAFSRSKTNSSSPRASTSGWTGSSGSSTTRSTRTSTRPSSRTTSPRWSSRRRASRSCCTPASSCSARRSRSSRCPTTSPAGSRASRSLGRLGLLTHSTAGFIDPGFTGHITLELSQRREPADHPVAGHEDRAAVPVPAVVAGGARTAPRCTARATRASAARHRRGRISAGEPGRRPSAPMRPRTTRCGAFVVSAS